MSVCLHRHSRLLASRCGRCAEPQILNQTLPILCAFQAGHCLREVAPRLLRNLAWDLEESLEHEGAILILCQRHHSVPALTEDLEDETLPVCIRAVRERRLDDVAGTPVACIAPQISMERFNNTLTVLRQVLQNALQDVVPEGVLAEVLSISQNLSKEVIQIPTGAGVLNEPAEDAASKTVACCLCTHTFQLLHYKGGHCCWQCCDDCLDHVVCVWRCRGVTHAAIQLSQKFGYECMIGHLDCSLHQTTALEVKRQLGHRATYRGQRNCPRLTAILKGCCQSSTI
mmetsp:Transcript_53716/g.156588  ORF Transcript_53716/g.156588 Transcript_53716/m.156588 type:complete len:285 (-) Transcript_53716:459-1313(-)